MRSSPRNINYVFIVAFAGNLLALTGDTTLTWSSPVLPKLYSNDTNVNPLGRPITADEESWIGSLQYIGAMCGILPFAVLADWIGRKPVLLALAFPHIISFIIFAFAKHINWYYLGRFLGGVSLSSVYIVLPMYVAEISEDSYRGMLLVSYSTFASFGDLFPYITGPYMSLMWFNLTLVIFPIVFVVLFFLLAPESPYFYVNKNDYKAEECLTILRSRKENLYNVKEEIDEIKNEINKNKKGDIFNTLKKKYVIKGFFVALGLSSLQQLSGLGAILAYTQFIFEAAGTKLSADVSSIIVGIVLFLASFGGPLIVDRKGRKFLLICSSLGIIISEIILGTYFYLLDNSVDLSNVSWLPILCLVVYTVTFNIGYGPLPYTITSEVLPSNIKFFLATVTGFTGWLMSFLITKFFNDLNNALGRGGTFWLFSGFCVAGLFFIIFVVPETKGRSFQEIQALLDK